MYSLDNGAVAPSAKRSTSGGTKPGPGYTWSRLACATEAANRRLEALMH